MKLEELAVRNICKRHKNAVQNGFSAAVKKITAGEWKGQGFVPDATEINQDSKVLTLYEVEDTSPLSDLKIHNLQSFANDLYDEFGWYLRVVCTDRYGLVEHEVYTVKDDIFWCHADIGSASVTQIEQYELGKKQ